MLLVSVIFYKGCKRDNFVFVVCNLTQGIPLISGITHYHAIALHGRYTVEHTYDACPKYSELGSFFMFFEYLYVSEGSRR